MHVFLWLVLFALLVSGCSNEEQVKPPKQELPELPSVDLPALSISRTDESIQFNWVDEIALVADQKTRVSIPLNFLSNAEILTAVIDIIDSRKVVIAASAMDFAPDRSPTKEFSFELGPIKRGTYTYQFTFQSGEAGAIDVTKITGRVVVR